MTASVATTAALSAQLSKDELEQARQFLQQTQDCVIGATRGLSEAQWNYKSAPEKWSLAENLEHIVIVQERVLGRLEQLGESPAAPPARDIREVDAIVIHQFTTRLAKFSSPEIARPAAVRVSPPEWIDRFRKNCVRLSDALETVPGLREHALEAPPLKAISNGRYTVMDGYQWILAAAAHTERHAKQMLEVRAGCGYPE
jgi:hypothetical protein